MASPKFALGELVFAKVRGYAAWPAKIEYFDNSNQSTNKVKYGVCFYGTDQIAVCKEEELFSYTENRTKFGKPKKLKGFMKAINQADSELKLARKSSADSAHVPDQISNLTHLNFLEAERKVLEINRDIKISLTQHEPNLDSCLQLLDEYSQVIIAPLIYTKNPILIDTIIKLLVFSKDFSLENGHPSGSDESIASVEENMVLIRKKARDIFRKIQSVYTIPRGMTFVEHFTAEVVQLQKDTKNMSENDFLQLSEENRPTTSD